MLYSNARLRYLAALGLPALPVTFGLLACDGASNPPPETPPSPTATAESTAATTTGAEPATTPTAAPAGTPTAGPWATATPEPTATATDSATAQAPVASWKPTMPPKPPPDPNHRPRPTCPNGKFCLASAPAQPGAGAEPPFEACSASAQIPDRSQGGPPAQVSFDAETTRRERGAHPGACCYSWYIRCPGGRALRGTEGAVAAESVERGDWSSAVPRIVANATAAERDALAAHWEREAASEHASIAAFARASLSLLAAGAPADLVATTHAAALDEVEHARAAYALASAYSGTLRGPGPLDLGTLAPVATTPAGVAAETFIDACAGESVAALALREAASAAADPAIAEILSRIAADEERHADLAWRTVAWALRDAGESARQALLAGVRTLEEGLLAAEGACEPDGLDLSAHGVLPASARRAIHRRALADVVLPCARALLAHPTSGNLSRATSGNLSRATSGNRSRATSGNLSRARRGGGARVRSD